MWNHSNVIYNANRAYLCQPKSMFIYMCVLCFCHMHCCRVCGGPVWHLRISKQKKKAERKYCTHVSSPHNTRAVEKKNGYYFMDFAMWPMSCQIILHIIEWILFQFSTGTLAIELQVILLLEIDVIVYVLWLSELPNDKRSSFITKPINTSGLPSLEFTIRHRLWPS